MVGYNGIELPPTVAKQAALSLGAIRRANFKPLPAIIHYPMGEMGSYMIRSDTR